MSVETFVKVRHDNKLELLYMRIVTITHNTLKMFVL